MSQSTIATERTRSEHAMWRWTGALMIGSVVLMWTAFALQGTFGDPGAPADEVAEQFRALSVDRVKLFAYVEALSFLPFLVALILLVRLLGTRTHTSAVAGQTALGLAVAGVAAGFAIGFPPLTVAVEAAHDGVGAVTVGAIHDLRVHGYVLGVALRMALAVAIGVLAVAEGRMTRWTGWGGVIVGSLGLVVTPFMWDEVSLLWTVWWLGVAVLALKGGPREVDATD